MIRGRTILGMAVGFCGSLDVEDGALVAGLLGEWLGLGLRPKVRLLGWEVYHDGEAVEVYAREALAHELEYQEELGEGAAPADEDIHILRHP